MRRNVDESTLIFASLTQKYYTAAGSPYSGTSFDTLDYDDILVAYHAGTHVATGTVDITIEESDDGSSWSTLSGAVFTQVTDSTHQTTYLASIRAGSTKRYIRARAAVATADCNLGVFFIAQGRVLPVSQSFSSAFTIQ